jgi:hypothetical protein
MDETVSGPDHPNRRYDLESYLKVVHMCGLRVPMLSEAQEVSTSRSSL